MATQKHILVESDLGLYCLNLENGETLWSFVHDGTDAVIHGCTPAVDQTNGFIYYQSYNRLYKINAINGAMIAKQTVASPSFAESGNTVLVNDVHGYHILTYWYATAAYSGTIRCYDINLVLEWTVTGLNTTYKNVLCYHDGVVFTGTGDNFGNAEQILWYTGELEQCRIIAYNISDGSIKWTYDPHPLDTWDLNNRRGILECIYCNGYIVAETQTCGTKAMEVFVLNATTGALVRGYTHVAAASSCGRPALSKGKMFSGDLLTNTTLVTVVGTGAEDDFAPFGTNKTNSMESPDTALAIIANPIVSGGSVAEGNQGIVVYNSIVYANKETGGVVAFDVDTLAAVLTYTSGTLWDSSPMVVKNIADEDIILVKENANKRVKAMYVSDGSTYWVSDADMEGNLFFGFVYYESSFIVAIGGMTSAELIAAINANHATCNALVGDAATLITLSDELIGQDLLDAINDNFVALNAELGTPISYTDVAFGMTGTEFNVALNDFNTDFKLAV